MLKVNEITSLSELNNIIIPDAPYICRVPLFHGTRRYSLEASDEERTEFYDACDIIISFAKEILDQKRIDKEELFKYQRENEFFLTTVVEAKGSSDLFQYGDFYVTTSYPSAISFSNKIGGELGMNAYYQLVGFEHFGITLNVEAEAAAEIVRQGYEKYKSSERVVLAYYGVSIADLNGEDGYVFADMSIDEQRRENRMNRVRNRLDRTRVTDTYSSQENMRLVNYNNYTPYVITDENLRAGMSIFTRVKDVDKYLRWVETNLDI